MSEQNDRLKYLLQKNRARNCSPEEVRELYQLVCVLTDEEIHVQLDEQYSTIAGDIKSAGIDWEFVLGKITETDQPVTSSKRFFSMTWLKYAAVVALVATVAGYFFLPTAKKDAAVRSSIPTDKGAALPVPGNKAVLTLADGRSIVLDSAANGSIAVQGSSKILKLKPGELTYTPSDADRSGELLLNTISTPNGGEYQLKLPDGTRIWLNAATTLKFPAAFTGPGRTVELTGEAYFEVARNPAMPFYVKLRRKPEAGGEMTVEVLGTHFNINSYSEEPSVNTTLLEGSVKVTTTGANVTIAPGQQAVVSNSGAAGQPAAKIVVQEVNTAAAVAWKNGYFSFDRSDIRSVMRQLARWYDVSVSYEGNIPSKRFMGEIQKNLRLSDLLPNLEMIGIRSRLEGRRLIVMQ